MVDFSLCLTGFFVESNPDAGTYPGEPAGT